MLLILALSPGLAIILYVYLQDIHEPEPIGQLAIGFLYGILSMLLATGIIYLIYQNKTLMERAFQTWPSKLLLLSQ